MTMTKIGKRIFHSINWRTKSLGNRIANAIDNYCIPARNYLINSIYFLAHKKKKKVCVCAIVKNEASYLLEWIAYHGSIGVDHFFIYENDSTDGTPEMLRNLEQSGIITYINWPTKHSYKRGPQVPAYRDACKRAIGKYEWIAFIDIDEFIVPNRYNNLHDFLSEYEKFENIGAIAINWKHFGSSGQKNRSAGLVIERFQRCSLFDFERNRHFKTIAKVDLIKGIPYNPHRVILLKSYAYIYPDKTPFLPHVAYKEEEKISHEIIQVNHYFCKSFEEFSLKRSRGRAGPTSLHYYDCEIFDLNDRNEDEDFKILRFIDMTKEEIKRLKKLIS